MLGKRHPARSSGPAAFVLPLVLALLASALFPVLAGASDAPGVIYDEAPTTVPGKKKTIGEDGTRAGDSKSDSGGSTAPGGSEGTEESGGSAGGGSSTGGNNPSTGGSGDAGQGAGGKQGTAVEEAGSVGSGEAVTTAAADEDDSSSSPLVPILIAIAALAAISIGAFLIKQRRQRDGSDGAVSPKVG